MVSIHAPHARGDFETALNRDLLLEFQSTPLMRGATWSKSKTFDTQQVSIHAPHARGDIITPINVAMTIGFNPRPSCEGRQGKGQ